MNTTAAALALSAILPPRRLYELRREADFYGATQIIADALGMGAIPDTKVPWQHGCVFPERTLDGARYFMEDKTDREQVVLLGRPDEAEFLIRHGYRNAQAVGLPYTYVPPQGMVRVPRSLLIMPAHSLVAMGPLHSRQAEEALIERILDSSSEFEFIAICAHYESIYLGCWVETAAKYRLPLVAGAWARDRNSLYRMRRLFETFTHMTTDTIGSHLPYAAFSGCRVSWFGNLPVYTSEQLARDKINQNNPEGLANAVAYTAADNLEARFNFLRTKPWDGILPTEWARQIMGASHRVSIRKLGQLLGWSSASEPVNHHC